MKIFMLKDLVRYSDGLEATFEKYMGYKLPLKKVKFTLGMEN